MLEDITATVTAVGTADEGFQALHRQAWKLIITDVRTPGGTNGLQLAIAARQHQPDAGVIVMSGFYDEMSVPLPPGVRFLAKPWSSADFYALVEAQLA